MHHCLDRLEKIDPSPESAVRDCAAMIHRMPDEATRTEILQAIRKELEPQEIWDKRALDVIKTYSEFGTEIFPQDDDAVSYKHFKMLQLIKLDKEYVRIPAPLKYDRLQEFNENMDCCTLGMLQAAAAVSAAAAPKTGEQPPKGDFKGTLVTSGENGSTTRTMPEGYWGPYWSSTEPRDDFWFTRVRSVRPVRAASLKDTTGEQPDIIPSRPQRNQGKRWEPAPS
jgi:hypothetical protein